MALRSGISVEEVYDQLKGIRCPSTIRQQGMSCTSCPDAIAKVLAKVDRFIRENNNAVQHPEAEPTPGQRRAAAGGRPRPDPRQPCACRGVGDTYLPRMRRPRGA